MSKPPLRSANRSPSRHDPDELSDLMALLEEPALEDGDEPVDAGDLVALIEGLGASAKEREEAEVHDLLEGMPELNDDAGREVIVAGEEPSETIEAGEDDDGEVVTLQELFVLQRALTSPSLEARVASTLRTDGPGLIASEPPVRWEAAIPVDEEEAPVPPARDGVVVSPMPVREINDEVPGSVRDAAEASIRPVREEAVLPPLRDPLASRRALADKRVQQFLQEDVRTRLNFRLLRFFMVTGVERVSLDELQEELVEAREALKAALTWLLSTGLLVMEPSGYAINPRARKLSVLGTAIAQWQSPRQREEIWSSLQAANL